jgi:glycosyltransferase involved in cell wall biosynthesis
MNLLFIHQNFPGQYRQLAPFLRSLGHNVIGMGASPRPEFRDPLRLHYGWQERPLPEELEDATLEQQLRRAACVADRCLRLRQEGLQPDAVFFHSGWGEGLYLRDIWPAAVFLCYPELYADPALLGYGFDPDLGPVPEAIRRLLRRQNLTALAAIADSDAVIVPTLFQRDTFPPHLRSRLHVIHEGIDAQRIGPHPRRELQLTPQLRLGHGDPVVTLVSRQLEPLRGFRVLMRALPKLLQDHPSAQVVLVGGDGRGYGPTSSHPQGHRGELLEELGDRIDLSRVHFAGQVPYEQMIALLQISAAHVYFTYPYALSWSLLEAMACGALVVGSRNPPVTEVIQDGVNGRLVDFHSPEELADCLLEVLAQPAQFAPLAAEGRRTIERRYSLAGSARQYLELVGSLRVLAPMQAAPRRSQPAAPG